jgi:hypothetical protein
MLAHAEDAGVDRDRPVLARLGPGDYGRIERPRAVETQTDIGLLSDLELLLVERANGARS